LDVNAVRRSSRRPGLVLVLELTPGEQPEMGKEGKEVSQAQGRRQAEKYRIWLCGCEGQPRCEPVDVERLKKILFQCRCESAALVRSPREVSSFWSLKCREYVTESLLGNGSRLIGEWSAPGWDLSRLIEMDSANRLVWESVFQNPAGGMPIWSLV